MLLPIILTNQRLLPMINTHRLQKVHAATPTQFKGGRGGDLACTEDGHTGVRKLFPALGFGEEDKYKKG